MRRREFIVGLGATATSPLATRAQQPAMPVIGFLQPGSPATSPGAFVTAVHRGLSETGYVEGQNLAVEYRWAEDRLDRLPGLATDLVRRPVAVIVTAGTAAAFAAKAATNSIPIVFVIGSDAVETGLVASLNRPGGNLTGISILFAAMAAKRLELLHELLPAATLFAYLVNPSTHGFAEAETRELQVAARALGVKLLILNASDQSELETAFATLVREKADGLVVGGDILFIDQSGQLAALATRHKVPAMYPNHEATVAGGLMSYGTDRPVANRQVGIYAGRILKGEKPAELPVQQVTKIPLTINLKTAKALGLTIPELIMVRADTVIE
jgi:putative tryptophan/tyrosine transport system substrate-binding protein